jgi:aminoglycoside phosphotransferase (APT) family kinase protein
MPDDALNRLIRTVGARAAPQVLSNSSDGRVVAAFGDVVTKLGLPGEAARTAAVMQSVTDHLGEGSSLVLPRVLWVHDDVLAMERLSGDSFRTLATGVDAETAMYAAGRAVASLHAARVPELRPRHVADHVADLIRPHPDELATALPQLSRRIVALVDRVAHDLAEPAEPATTHRDLHLGQMFRAGGSVAIVDWDLAALGDPALDLGNLRAYLHTRLPATAGALWSAFGDGYGATLPNGVVAYEALMYLRMASKTFRLHGRAAVKQVGALISVAEACR